MKITKEWLKYFFEAMIFITVALITLIVVLLLLGWLLERVPWLVGLVFLILVSAVVATEFCRQEEKAGETVQTE